MKKLKKKLKKKYNKYLVLNKKSKIEKRYNILIVIISILMFVLLIGLFNVQILKGGYYKKEVEKLTSNIVYGDSAPRGRIYDRNGVVIVDNKTVRVIYYKKEIGVTSKQEIQIAYKLAEILDLNYKVSDTTLKKFWIKNNFEEANNLITREEKNLFNERKLTSKNIEDYKMERIDLEKINYSELDKKAAYIYNVMNTGYSNSMKEIKSKGVTDNEYAIVTELLEELPGVGIKLSWERVYPYGNTFRSILGSVSNIQYEKKDYYLQKGYSLSDIVGTSYLEMQYEDILKGTKNKYKIENGEYVLLEEGKRGKDIVLSIDIKLQEEIEKILDEEIIKTKTKEKNTEYYDGSFVVVSDPNSGEILAMAGRKATKVDDEYRTYDYTPGVVTSPVVMGSAVKGASHIVGYNTGALKIGEVRSDACLKLPGTNPKCSWKYLGTLNDITALKQSSNTYQYHTAIKVGQGTYSYNKPLNINLDAYNIYRDTFAEFGLGVKTGIDMPIESLGYKGKSDNASLLLDFSIGQYDSYTTIQMSQYINTIANGGYRLEPHLLKAVYEPTQIPLSNLSYEVGTKILNKVNTLDIYLERVKLGFKSVMESNGTGVGYINSSFKPAGKTGTSQTLIDTNHDNRVDTMVLNNSFVGFAPYDKPVVTFTVVSPNVFNYSGTSSTRSYVNRRISNAVSKKFFELYE
ncbi:MAG: penicillin-binding protein 2 [Clostridium sp.]|nr:penicillin-binding protein 2 [Clostridium sp.]MCM1444607.1 penicillin-binding protein 2 [Candidatus Amulumruptor caecigallinarius]